MKKYIILLGLAGIFASACKKLDREYITDLTDKKFIDQSYSATIAEATAIYTDLPEGFVNIDGAMMASASDEAEHTQETSDVQKFNTGSWNALSYPNNIWGTYYKAIRRANQFLAVPATQVNLDQYRLDQSASGQLTYTTRLAEMIRLKYEVRFLRALYYFELVKRYGGVPLITKELSADQVNLKRNTLDECIKFVTSECDSAANNLPLDYSAISLSTNYGRAGKLAALALKSRMLLYAASDLFNNPSWAAGYATPELISLPAGDRNVRWKAAADAAKAVIDLVPSPALGAYNTLFNNFNLPEIIMARRNSAASNDFEKATYPIGYDLGNSGTTPSGNLVDAYEVKVNATTSIPFDWNNPAHAANPYANRDPRLGFTIITNGSTFKSRVVQSYVGGLDGKPKAFATRTGYYLKKYVIESLNLLLGNTGQHSWILFRHPEIWLNYAEALNEYNPGDPNIKVYVDKVRARTGVAMPPLPAGLSQAAMRDRIRNEKQVEFAFEDFRFWDTRRWMIAPGTLGAPLRGVDITKDAANVTTYVPNIVEQRTFVANKMYLFPIPQSERNIDNALVQNPGW